MKRFIFLLGVGIFILSFSGCSIVRNGSESKNHEHLWGEPTYNWSSDYLSCTAEMVCSYDASHKKTEIVNSSYEIITESKCESDGLGRYTALFTNSAFSMQTLDVVLDALGHIWGETIYTWTDDYSSCSAKRICNSNSSHIQIETKQSNFAIITPASSETTGLGRYTAIFDNNDFQTQTHDVVLEKLQPDPLGQKPRLSVDGKTITYGLYPKNRISNKAIIHNLELIPSPEDNGWYLYNGEYYAKTQGNTFDNIVTFDNGDLIDQCASYWFKCEPIEWTVFESKYNEFFVVSNYLLDAHCFYHSHDETRIIDNKIIYPNNYKHSDIRKWLNDEFFKSAFYLDNNFIETTIVDNSASTTDNSDNQYACENTEDKVFLPSYQDYINEKYGFPSTNASEKRYCKTTEWARCRGAYVWSQSGVQAFNGDYWTRSPYSFYQHGVETVQGGGLVTFCLGVSDSSGSVRPGLVIKILEKM